MQSVLGTYIFGIWCIHTQEIHTIPISSLSYSVLSLPLGEVYVFEILINSVKRCINQRLVALLFPKPSEKSDFPFLFYKFKLKVLLNKVLLVYLLSFQIKSAMCVPIAHALCDI